MTRARILAAFLVLLVWTGSAAGVALAGRDDGVGASGKPTEPTPFAGECDPAVLPPVWTPPSYVDLRDELAARIIAFYLALNSSWNGTRYPVAFAAELSSASAHRARDLLNASNYWGILLELDRLAALGLRAVTASVSFPLFDSNFTTDSAEFQAYVDFYVQLRDDVHARGMQFMVDSSELFPTYTALPVQAYYDNLSYADYQRGRLETVLTIARDIQPDFMGIGAEPDTEEMLTGQPVATPAAFTALVNYILSGLESAGVTGVPIGAGVGTWDPLWFFYATSLAQNTNLSAIDVHVYPVNSNYLDRALSVVDIAKANGKDATMTEAWLYKARDSELGLGVTYDAIFARDAYGFFAPLDVGFVKTMVTFAYYKELEYMSLFWEKYLFAYLDYNTTLGMTPAEIQYWSNLAAISAMLNNETSVTGHAYAVAIDETAPTAPSNFAAAPLSTSEVQLTWSASTDLIGVWCYRIRRDGTEIATTKGTSLTDSGLSPSTTYAYEVVAYDEAGNASPPAGDTATTNAPNVGPMAAFAYTPANPTTDDPVSFSDSSTDSDGTVVAWSWDLGDGTYSMLRNPTHVFTTAWTFTVTLTVTDDGGLTDSATQQVVVSEPLDTTDPTVSITTPVQGAILSSGTVTMTGIAADNVAVDRVELSVDGATWIDATGTTSWTGAVTLAEGANTIRARATDSSGNTAVASITVTYRPPGSDGSGMLLVAAIAGVVLAIVFVLIFLYLKRKKRP